MRSIRKLFRMIRIIIGLKRHIKALKKITKRAFVKTASGDNLTRLGLVHGVDRYPNESDGDYSKRLYAIIYCPLQITKDVTELNLCEKGTDFKDYDT